MFPVLFDVHPKPEQWDAYPENAKRSGPIQEEKDPG
jgi:hypothetical protein